MKNKKFLDITMAIISMVCLLMIFFIKEANLNINFSLKKKNIDLLLFTIAGISTFFLFIINYLDARSYKNGTNEKKLSLLNSISMLVLSISCFLFAAVLNCNLSSYLFIGIAVMGLLFFVIVVPIIKLLINKK